MLLLAVDTATRAGSVAVLRDDQLLGEIFTASQEEYSSRLFRQLDFLLGELDLETQNFDIFAVVAGPGSFTGLRVGLAAVKGWAEVFSKPIVAVSGLEAIAAQARHHGENELIAPLLDARRGQIFAALYRRVNSNLVAEGPEQVSTVEEFLEQLAQRKPIEPVSFISPTPNIFEELAAKAGGKSVWPDPLPKVQRASAVLAPVIGRLARERAARGETTDALGLDANYIRRSDAELLWKTR